MVPAREDPAAAAPLEDVGAGELVPAGSWWEVPADWVERSAALGEAEAVVRAEAGTTSRRSPATIPALAKRRSRHVPPSARV